jgi:hypothetical protein
MDRGIRVLMLLALIVLGTTSLVALPPNEVITEYYTSAAKTELCGERILFCNGSTWSWGCVTSYWIRYAGEDC